MAVTQFLMKQVFTGNEFRENLVVSVENGKITALNEADHRSADIVLSGLVVPGFIDLQVNGGGGVLFNDTPTLDAINTIFNAHACYGTTSMMPTVITDKIEIMQQAADAVAQAMNEPALGIIGIHFEGPHLSVAKKGVHNERFIRPISDKEWQIFSRRDLGQILVTLAPETVCPADIAKLVSLGVKVCLGHSNASYQQAQQALSAGASGFTHLYNAMSPFQGREPGMVGAALLNDDAYCGLIVDGHHVDYAACQLALKTKPQGKVFLVTDAMSPVGTNKSAFTLLDKQVELTQGKLIAETGELAGSILTMIDAVNNSIAGINIPLEQALNMASLYPAQYLNVSSSLGVIQLGNQANFVELTANKPQLYQVVSSWLNGQKIYSNPALHR